MHETYFFSACALSSTRSSSSLSPTLNFEVYVEFLLTSIEGIFAPTASGPSALAWRAAQRAATRAKRKRINMTARKKEKRKKDDDHSIVIPDCVRSDDEDDWGEKRVFVLSKEEPFMTRLLTFCRNYTYHGEPYRQG